jgi:hypothetical protein
MLKTWIICVVMIRWQIHPVLHKQQIDTHMNYITKCAQRTLQWSTQWSDVGLFSACVEKKFSVYCAHMHIKLTKEYS